MAEPTPARTPPDDSITPVQVLMPPALLSRMEFYLASAGMRLYRVPVKDDLVTFLVGVDMAGAEPASDGRWPAPVAVEAYADAVTYLAEAESRPRPKSKRSTRKRGKAA